MLFENDNNYLNMLFNVNNMDNFNSMNNNTPAVESDAEGFLRGNMFTNEYVPYKNMTYIKPKLKTERERDLFKIMEVAFAINDYNLYLDLNPEDAHILNKYKACTEKFRRLTKEYEEKYGPLTIDASNYNTFKWIESPWPWEREDGKYV
ncbi:MAG: spore coat protein CotJB [Firmicutes bacterium]|nr:spore coat protein CotJB [Bacillota bacterium]